MAFSQATITDGPNYAVDGDELRISWASSSPAGTVFQLYQDGIRIWSGTERQHRIPYPTEPAIFDVGTVGAGEETTDFSGSLASFPGSGQRATLTWTGGRFEGADLAEFRVYSGTVPGGAVSYASPVATVRADRGGLWQDGYNQSGYNQGGYGSAAIPFSWTSGRLAPGVWNFGVKAADAAGNESAAATVAVTINAPPRPPAANSAGKRLTYTYNPGTRVPTLAWLAAPN